MHENIEKIKALTDKLTDEDFDMNFNSLPTIKMNSGSGIGNIMISKIYTQPNGDVSLVLMTKGSAMRVHRHGVKQVINMLEGELHIAINDKNKVISHGDVEIIDNNCAHSIEAVEDVWFLLINLPSDDQLANRFNRK